MIIGDPLRRSLLALLLIFTALPLAAQDESRLRRGTLVLGGGAGIPSGDLTQFLSSSAAVRLKVGYRITRYLEANVGLDVVMRAAGISKSQQTWVGEIRIKDSEYMIPFGGRAILPMAAGWVELFAGGGGAYLRYDEEADIPGLSYSGDPYGSSSIDIPCPACTARSGWGYYGTAGVNIALERRKRVWVGIETQYLHGSTSGTLLGNGVRFETNDGWFIPTFNVVFRF